MILSSQFILILEKIKKEEEKARELLSKESEIKEISQSDRVDENGIIENEIKTSDYELEEKKKKENIPPKDIKFKR